MYQLMWSESLHKKTEDRTAKVGVIGLGYVEYGGDTFWFSARHQQGDDGQVWEQNLLSRRVCSRAFNIVSVLPCW